jgi:phosphoribosylglycinamide formyltransferase 1
MLSNKNKFNIVVCASGGGGNFQVLVDHEKENNYIISLLIVDRHCGAITRAIENKINHTVIDKKSDEDDFFMAIDNKIPKDTDLIVLAGFMPILTPVLCQKWKNKIINTHPSLLPKYGGKGMYGVKVQEAVMANKEKYAGCTIHYVNEGIDEGEIILQKKIKVENDETPWELGGRIFKEEGILLVKAINILKGDISV